MEGAAKTLPSQPAVGLALTFLLIGLTFALPYRLVPDSVLPSMSGTMSPEVANVYACVAWAGWAHFVFAFRGQGGALSRIRDEHLSGRMLTYVTILIGVVVVLTALRWAAGPALFSAVVWVYFIDHFIKAEQSFDTAKSVPMTGIKRWLASYQSLLAFGWLSLVLLDVEVINDAPWVLWTGSLLVSAVVLYFGGWRKLSTGSPRGPLLSMFFVAEALVWGTYSNYGGPMFLFGVYVFHIAAGSYFHYLGSYFFAQSRAKSMDRLLHPIAILVINLVFIALGYLVIHFPPLSWLTPILGIQWFTLWVGVHLVSSDLFPLVKRWKTEPQRVRA